MGPVMPTRFVVAVEASATCVGGCPEMTTSEVADAGRLKVLSGVKVVELGGMGPGPFAGMGPSGRLSQCGGHDINYIGLAGSLAQVGRRGAPPTPPLNIVGDFGGGGLLLAFGIVAALLDARRTGQGRVVDAAMIDGVAL